MKKIISATLLIIVTVIAAGAQDISTVEQNGEALRAQLRSLMDKQTELQARLAQLEEDLKPENIQRTIVGIGTTDANALRDQRQQQLEREKVKVEEQMRSLDISRTRLEASLASAEAEAVRQRAAALGVNNAAPTQVTTTNPSVETSTGQAKKPNVSQTKRRRPRRTRRRAH